jgi:hypothetical protein
MSEPRVPGPAAGGSGSDEAGPGSASGDAQLLAEQGALLIQRVVALMRTARTYDVSNMAFQRQLQDSAVRWRLERRRSRWSPWPTTTT